MASATSSRVSVNGAPLPCEHDVLDGSVLCLNSLDASQRKSCRCHARHAGRREETNCREVVKNKHTLNFKTSLSHDKLCFLFERAVAVFVERLLILGFVNIF